MTVVTVTVLDQLGAPVPIIARVAIFLNNELVVYQSTNASGVADFLLDDGTYVARVMLSNAIYEAPDPVTLEVDETEDNAFEIEVEKIVYPAVADALLCVCGGSIRSIASAEVDIDIEHIAPIGVLDGALNVFAPTSLKITCVPSVPTVAYLPRGGRFRVGVGRLPTWEIVVPNAASAPLQEVLFPVLDDLIPEDTTPTLAIGETLEIKYDELYSSGLLLDLETEASLVDQDISQEIDEEGVTVASSDTTVVTVGKSGGVLLLTGVSAGTAVVSASIKQLFNVTGAVDEIATLLSVEVTA